MRDERIRKKRVEELDAEHVSTSSEDRYDHYNKLEDEK